MDLTVEFQDTTFRVVTQVFSLEWRDTPANRQAVVVFLRGMRDTEGRPVFTLQQLAAIVESEHRQAASQHVEDFRACGEDVEQFVRRQRKVDGEVVEVVRVEVMREPLIETAELCRRVNARLGRDDLSAANIEAALEQISCREVRRVLRHQVERGEVQYTEAYLLERLWALAGAAAEAAEPVAGLPVGAEGVVGPGTVPLGGVSIAEGGGATLEALVTGAVRPERLAAVWEGAGGWKVWALVLYLQGVSLAVIGGWLGVHKSTVCRWLTEVAAWGETWVVQQRVAFSGRLAVDEKWVRIGQVWWYLFVAVDCVTGYPLHLALYPSNSGAYCRLFLLEVKRLGYWPKVVITDGWDAYAQALAVVFPQAEHLLCRFHVLRALYRRLRQAQVRDGRIWRLVGRLFRTRDKRTVRRRVATLQGLLEGAGAGAVGERLQAKLPQVIGAVGSTWRPSTANAAEGVFRAFDRFYRLKGPFCDEESALKHVALFRLGVLLQLGAQGQACPLERAGVDVATIPLYHLLNRPNVLRLRERMAAQYAQAA